MEAVIAWSLSLFPRPANQRLYGLVAASALLFLSATRADDWHFDVLKLKNGSVFQGQLVREDAAEIYFRCVFRHAGSPTVVISTVFSRSEIDTIHRLTSAERDRLMERLKALDPTGRFEAIRMDSLELQTVPCAELGAGHAFRYFSSHFVLLSNARQDIVRRAAVRLEQIYAAYARFLAPRRQAAQPTRILLVRSLAEYHALLKEQGRNILNPAFYDAQHNQIICASDLESLGAELERVHKQHRQLLEELKKQEAELRRQYGRAIPTAMQEQISARRREICAANQKNEATFKDATRHLFQTLYHEAFHAYLAQFVYPPDEAEVPRWLNEGLGQIFESALLEAGEVRVGHADPDRLAKAKRAVRCGQMVSLAQLLEAGPQQFLIGHSGEQPVSERSYLSAWALAFYLTFDRHLLGTPELDRYVHSLHKGTDPIEAFRQLVGEPLTPFEDEFHRYLLRLRTDGTAPQAEGTKDAPGHSKD
jgi:hypothetical protein